MDPSPRWLEIDGKYTAITGIDPEIGFLILGEDSTGFDTPQPGPEDPILEEMKNIFIGLEEPVGKPRLVPSSTPRATTETHFKSDEPK